MNIETKGLIAALVAGAVVVGASFGLSAIMVARTHQAPYQTRGAARQAENQRMTTSMETNKRKMSATMEQAQLVQGHQFYSQSCSSCHGATGQGGFGPSLQGEKKSDAQIAAIITAGVKGRMPAFGSKYNNPQTQALVAYVRSLK